VKYKWKQTGNECALWREKCTWETGGEGKEWGPVRVKVFPGNALKNIYIRQQSTWYSKVPEDVQALSCNTVKYII